MFIPEIEKGNPKGKNICKLFFPGIFLAILAGCKCLLIVTFGVRNFFSGDINNVTALKLISLVWVTFSLKQY